VSLFWRYRTGLFDASAFNPRQVVGWSFINRRYRHADRMTAVNGRAVAASISGTPCPNDSPLARTSVAVGRD